MGTACKAYLRKAEKMCGRKSEKQKKCVAQWLAA